MNKNLFLPTVALSALLFATAAQAQIVVSKTAGYAVDLAGLQSAGPEGAIFKRTLQNDLTRSGAFTVVAEGASYPITGVFTPPATAAITVRSASFTRTFSHPGGDPRWLAHMVADALLVAIADEKPWLCSKLVLSGKRSGHWELYICDSDGENLKQITQDRSMNLYPSWSPDGNLIVFTSYRRRFPDLYTINLARREISVLANYNGLNTSGAYSPNGRELVFSSSASGNPELYILRQPVKGGRLYKLTSTSAAETGASWSPDGKRIVFVSDTSKAPQLYILNRETGERTKLPVAGSENVSPDWGPDGRIAFASRRAGQYHICVYNPETGAVEDLTGDSGNFEDPTWAPDGRHIACTRTSGNGNTIYILDSKGKPSIPLLKVEGGWRSPSWSALLP